ncbi:hypothetical protein PAPYR_13249 [Paratrimastix pyriformis]|uniref:Protein kinase domain-containing protein n=1 Tax=Paratrimastix pyriformis TaxID=342808 RepID=A0ABQ8U5G4_9EUKA|nr:hypothetical protein PAPYR_13249 [Paratrimastix pyriformis]
MKILERADSTRLLLHICFEPVYGITSSASGPVGLFLGFVFFIDTYHLIFVHNLTRKTSDRSRFHLIICQFALRDTRWPRFSANLLFETGVWLLVSGHFTTVPNTIHVSTLRPPFFALASCQKEVPDDHPRLLCPAALRQRALAENVQPTKRAIGRPEEPVSPFDRLPLKLLTGSALRTPTPPGCSLSPHHRPSFPLPLSCPQSQVLAEVAAQLDSLSHLAAEHGPAGGEGRRPGNTPATDVYALGVTLYCLYSQTDTAHRTEEQPSECGWPSPRIGLLSVLHVSGSAEMVYEMKKKFPMQKTIFSPFELTQ